MFIEYPKNIEAEKLKEIREKQKKKNPGKYYREHVC